MSVVVPSEVPGFREYAPFVNYKRPGDLFTVFPQFDYVGEPSVGTKIVVELVSQTVDWEGISTFYKYAWDIDYLDSTSEWVTHSNAFNGRLPASAELGWYDAIAYLEADGKIVLWHLVESAFNVRA